MKQSRKSAVAFDLDELERELQQVSAPRKAAAIDDPLAELARIVGQDAEGSAQRPSGGRASFDDFLVHPQQPTAAPAGPLTAEPDRADADGAMPSAGIMISAPEVQPAQPRPVEVDPLGALLAQDLGLRSGLDDLAELSPRAAARPSPSLEDMLAESTTPSDAPISGSADAGPMGVSVHESEIAGSSFDVHPPTVSPAGAGAPAAQGAEPDVQFDDMLAEFEAAMRDVGADAAPTARVEAAPPAPTYAPIIVPPPPADMVMPRAPVFDGAEPDGPDMPPPAKSNTRRGAWLAIGSIGIAVIGLGGLALFGAGTITREPGEGPAPVIAAKPGVTKERPANPGGVEVPNQDKEILQARAPQAPEAERVAPREEQPLDLTQAQRQIAAATAAAQTASTAQVRQIPGVAIVAPVTTVPPPSAPPAAPAAPVEPPPQPRPVASVPIVIAGQPPAPPAAPVAPPAAPVAPAPVAPPAAAAPPAASQTASAAIPTPPAPAAATPGTPAATTPATAEPRRVRAVPIRPANGEAAPTRAQPQPRVVAAAPAAPAAAASAPDAGNTPLRITPQASREPAPAPRVNAPVQPGTVPSSQPTLETETATAPIRTASTGSGFAVQLAAEGSEDAARAKFNRMRGQFGSVLSDTSPNIRSAEVNGRSVYRVRVGNMSRDEAVSMCERLKASGGSCFVARN